MKGIILGICMVAALAACAPMPVITQQQLDSADYGAPISQADATQLAKTWLNGYLKDPYSAVEEWQPVQKGIVTTSLLDGHKQLPGYMMDGTVNAKNSYGGYIGARAFRFLFRDGKIERVMAADPDTGAMIDID
jgi:hypothetical protein